jgi:hypothetical protein
MSPLSAERNLGNGAVFLISAYGVYEVIAAACSSPQTTEINAGMRAETLMKWVYIGLAQSAVLVSIAAIIDPAHRRPIIGGAGVAATFMYLSYRHAKAAGLANPGPPTESY